MAGYKAVACRAFEGIDSLRVEEVSRRPLAPNEIRVRVRAAGINFADTLIVAGKYQVKPPFPFSPGLEAAGEVIEAGSAVTLPKIGDRVAAVVRHGAYAEEVVVPAAAAIPIPDSVDDVTAAAFPIVYGTAALGLFERGGLRPGETLLVLGAAGGVGLAAVELGRRAGAVVIAAAGSPGKLALAAGHGAAHGIDYSRESIRDRVRALTDGRGADVVFDAVGGDAFDAALRAVNWRARLLIVGFASGRIPQIPANHVLVKNVAVISVLFGAEMERDPRPMAAELSKLFGAVAAGELRPLVSQTYPMREAPTALHALLSRRHAGKIVLTMG